jgi:hypothetical protein
MKLGLCYVVGHTKDDVVKRFDETGYPPKNIVTISFDNELGKWVVWHIGLQK